MNNLFPFAKIISQSFLFLKESISSENRIQYLFSQLGWSVNLPPSDVQILASVKTLVQKLSELLPRMVATD